MAYNNVGNLHSYFFLMTCWYTFPRRCPLPTLQYIGRFAVQENIFIPLYFNSYFSNISYTARLYLYRFWAFLISFAHLCESSKLSDIYVHISFILNSKCLSAFIIFQNHYIVCHDMPLAFF